MNSDRADVNVTVKRVDLGFLQLISPVALKVNDRINITYAGCRIDSRVIRSNVLTEDSHLVSMRLLRCAGFELRAEPRIPVNIPATLTLIGGDEQYDIRIADFSQSGIGITVPANLPVAQQVCVDMGTGVAICEVRYSRVAKSGFHAGLLIVEFLPREVGRTMTYRDSPVPASLGSVVSLIRNKRWRLFESDPASPTGESDTEPVTP